MKKSYLLSILFLCLAQIGFAQSLLHYTQPSYWEIYDFSSSTGHNQFRARDILAQHAPKNNNQVIDTIKIRSSNFPSYDANFAFENIDEFNVFNHRIRMFGPTLTYFDFKKWNFNIDGQLTEMFEYHTDPDTTLKQFRIHQVNADGLTTQIYYGLDTAQVDSNSSNYGLANYYYTGMRLDSNTYSRLNGIKFGTTFYYYTGTRFDSILYNNGNGYYFERNHFTYDVNGNLLKDSVSRNWPSMPSYDEQYVKNWGYLPNGNLDTVFVTKFYSGLPTPWPHIEMKIYYNADNNYDSLYIKQGAVLLSYTFTYQPSTFGKEENPSDSNFQPYPNPVRMGDQLFLESGTQSAKLYAIDGTLVKAYDQIENNKIFIPNQIKQGMYIVQWFTEESIIPKTQKLIIRN